MADVDLNALVGKLSPVLFRALEQAAWLCRSQTHYEIEVEHLLMKVLEETGTDLEKILRHYGVDSSNLAAHLTSVVGGFKRGNTRDTPGISPRLPDLLQSAWLQASLQHGFSRIRSGNLLFALLTNAEALFYGNEISPELKKVDTDDLEENFLELVDGSAEDKEDRAATPTAAPTATPSAPGSPAPPGAKALDRFTIDLTARASAGEIDPVLCRDDEIRLMVDILMRRRQNNPILTGEAGVGKTAVVEGFAARVAQGDVPPPLQTAVVRNLDLGLLQAGAGVKGEFENRLKQVISEVKASPVPIILFIDEAHTLIGSGGQAGSSDAANLLKPALARGELRTIAATTWAEYKKYFEKDAALARRFQVVKVEEPEQPRAKTMLRGLLATLEKHHGIRVLPEAIDSAVELSNRYLFGRQLPDKAVSLLDTAAARIAVGQSSTPPSLERAEREIAHLETEHHILEREVAVAPDCQERLMQIDDELANWKSTREELLSRFDREKELVSTILGVRAKLDAPPAAAEAPSSTTVEPPDRDGLLAELRAAEGELTQLQGEDPLVRPYLDANAVAEIVSGWTGIPVGRMVADEGETLLHLEELLARRVVGQDDALRVIARRIQTSRAQLDEPRRPVGVFLLMGPSGVGKTETGLTLSELLFGGERNVITINMSEFQERHTVSSLKGSPPGYVGYGEGGVLTEAVRRRPYSVVLLDEVEKAHPDVMELFYQVFDKGTLEDGEGRVIDFSNCVIILTSNLGTDTIVSVTADEETRPTFSALTDLVRQEAISHFKPALVGRLTVVPYGPLPADVMRMIIGLKLDKIRRRLEEHHRIAVDVAAPAVETILSRCTAHETGARNIDLILSDTVLPQISRLIIGAIVGGTNISRVEVGTGEDGDFTYSTS